MTGIPLKTRELVRERDRGSCRRCGKPGNNIHHRITRGMGGSRRAEVNDLSVLVTLCGSGTTGCHGYVTSHPAYAFESGWSIRRSNPEDPETIPVHDLAGRQIFFFDDGGEIIIEKQETTKSE
jgi:hypothetical protein